MIELAHSVDNVTDPYSESDDVQVDAIISRWQRDEPPDALAVLSQFPQLHDDKEKLFQLVLADYHFRVDAGQDIDIEAYCDHFGSHRQSVRALLGCHQYFVNHPSELDRRNPSAVPPLPRTDRIGQYRLLRMLGRGGLARVYLAADIHSPRQVVLKISKYGLEEARIVVPLELDDEQQVVSRVLFVKPISSGGSMIAMPLVGLATLEHVLAAAYADPNGPASSDVLLEATRARIQPGDQAPRELKLHPQLSGKNWEQAVTQLASWLASGLAYLHSRGIRHRDLKMSNILLRWDGRPVILDFNLAEDVALDDPQIGGTLRYMAPEQIQASIGLRAGAAALDHRADLYSFGLMLYELLTGTHPFDPPQAPVIGPRNIHWILAATQILGRQREGAPSLAAKRPGLDHALVALVDRCLKFDPAERPQSAREIADELTRILDRPMRQKRARRQRRLAVITAACIGLSCIAVAAGARFSHRATDDERRLRMADVALKSGDYPTARKEALWVLEWRPGHAQAKSILVMSLRKLATSARKNGDFKKAEEYYSELLKLEPDDELDIRRERGIARMRNQDFDGAIHDFNKTKEEDGTGKSSYLLALAFASEGRYEQAMQEIAHAQSCGMNNAALWSIRAWCIASISHAKYPMPKEIEERYENAMRAARKAIELDDNCGAAWFTFAVVSLRQFDLTRKGDYIFASADALERALELCPPSTALYRTAIAILAAVRQPTAQQSERLWECMRLAAQYDCKLSALVTIPRFRNVVADPEFQKVLQVKPIRKADSILPQLPEPVIE